MGVIQLARDVGLDRDVALKVLSPQLTRSGSFLLGFQREASSLARIRHENIVQVYAFGTHDGAPFFAMEHVRGRDLSRLIADHAAAGARVPLARAITVISQIAAGLDAVHRAGLVHRDVKPSNIVVEHGTGRPVLVDFGLAAPAARVEGGAAVGTPAYMSPEQAMGFRDVGAAADQYGLACAVFELFTGDVPFVASDTDSLLRMQVRAPAPPPSSRLPRLAAIDAVMAQAMAKDPAARFPACSTFARALAQAAVSIADVADSGSTLRAASPAERPTSPSSGARTVRVVVVSDDPLGGRLAQRAAQIAFYRTRVRASVVPSHAVDALDAAPDLVVTDETDAFAAITTLRSMPRGHAMSALVLRARADERFRYAALGVEDFMEGPVELSRVVGCIQRLMARAGWAVDVADDEVQP